MGAVSAPRKDQHPTFPDLNSASTPALRQLYAEYLGSPPPGRAAADFLRSNIAWAVQVLIAGKDPVVLRKTLLDAVGYLGRSKRDPYKPGTRLIREWQGEIHEVTVLENGYRWQGRRYRSLSPIAEEITGAHWSGPRFFGTNKGNP